MGAKYRHQARVCCHNVITSLVTSMTSSADQHHQYLMGDECGDCVRIDKRYVGSALFFVIYMPRYITNYIMISSTIVQVEDDDDLATYLRP
jgi:hypothetical protein